MFKLLLHIINTPSRIWDSLFLFKIQHVEEIFVISPNKSELDEVRELMNYPPTVNFVMKHHVVIQDRKVSLGPNQIAIITTSKCWWKKAPSVDVRICER
jgi:hypothetical protein